MTDALDRVASAVFTRETAEQAYIGAMESGVRSIIAHASKSLELATKMVEAATLQARVDGYTLEQIREATGVRPLDPRSLDHD